MSSYPLSHFGHSMNQQRDRVGTRESKGKEKESKETIKSSYSYFSHRPFQKLISLHIMKESS